MPSAAKNMWIFDTLMVFLKEFFENVNLAFANSLDPDQAQQNVSPDLDPIYLTF